MNDNDADSIANDLLAASSFDPHRLPGHEMSHVLEWRAALGVPALRGGVRPLVEKDIPWIADLHGRLFGTRNSLPERQSYLQQIFWDHPWCDERLPSLVYEEDGGRIVGCLGVMPRPMWMDGRPITAAVTHSFMVEPDRRSTLAALQIIRAFLAGPQDLSLAEGNQMSRRLWEGIGGTTSLLHSIRWTHPLRPARYAVSLLEKRGLPWSYARALQPFCRTLDLLATRLPESPLRQRPSNLVAEELDAAVLLDGLSRFAESCILRPRYDREALEWLFDILTRKTSQGALRKVLLRKESRVLGWYIYYVKPGGIGEVVQIGAKEESAPQVLDHLFHDAWQRGAVAVSGQLDASLMPAFSEKFCLFHRGRDGSWVLVHSRDQSILRALHVGDAFFTRLEGEWWIAA